MNEQWQKVLPGTPYPRLTRVATSMVGRPVTIQALDQSVGSGTGDYSTDTVGVWKGGLKALTRFPRVLNEAALFAFAHEIGHLVTIAQDPTLKGVPNQTGGIDVSMELSLKRERVATAWARQNVYKIALALGANPSLAATAARRVKIYSKGVDV